MLEFQVHRATPECWTARHLPDTAPDTPDLQPVFDLIETRARKTATAGKLPLWEGYHALEDYPGDVSATATRSSNQVRTMRRTGEFYSWLVTAFRPKEIVEIGSAFGVSGMYWCAGLAANGAGGFTGFEPNDAWRPHAQANVQAIWEPAQVVEGTFEDNLDRAPGVIDLAFIDAIHTPDFVAAQLSLVLDRARPGALIVLDDIRFSKPMAQYWQTVRSDSRFAATFEVTRRVGILEVAG